MHCLHITTRGAGSVPTQSPHIARDSDTAPAAAGGAGAVAAPRVAAAGGSDRPSLGIHANPTVAAASEGLDWSRLERFELQQVARFLLPSHRVARCLHAPVGELDGSGSVSVHRSGSDAWLSGLQTCGSVWVCPVCSAKITEARRGELTAAITAARAMGWGVYLLTYTVSHGRSDALCDTLGGFLAAQEYLTGSRAYKRVRELYGVAGTIKALEVTLGLNGWHPHCHTLLFTLSPLSAGGVAELERDLFAVWAPAAARFGLSMSAEHGLSVKATWGSVADYVGKFGKQPARRVWGAEDELVKAAAKRARGGAPRVGRYTPFDLLRAVSREGLGWQSVRFREYVEVFTGRYQLVWGPRPLRGRPGLRDLLGLRGDLPADEALSAPTAEDTFWASLFTEEWYAVRRYSARVELLRLAAAGDRPSFDALVAELYSRYCAEYLEVS